MIQYVCDKKYKITIDCGFINGARKRKSQIFYGTYNKARLKEAELRNDVKSNKINLNKSLSFSDLTNMFINDYCLVSIRDNTLNNYKSLLKVILKELGNEKVEKITPYILQRYYNKLSNEYNYSTNTICHHYNLINNIFEKGCKWKVINYNPNRDIEKPRIIKKEKKIYDYEQVRDLLKALENEPIKYRAPIILGLDTGMRREELNGLKWDDIDFENSRLRIERTRVAVGKKIVVSDPKTEHSKREVCITELSMNALKELKEYQEDLKYKNKDIWNETGYVFINEIGEPYYPDVLSKMFKKLLKRNNLPYITFHALRHTSVSLLINNNEDIRTISDRVGHASTSTTLNMYSHVIEKSKKDVAIKMNSILTEL